MAKSSEIPQPVARSIFQPGYFPPLHSDDELDTLVPHGVPRRHVHHPLDNDTNTPLMSFVQTRWDPTFYQQFMVEEKIELPWPYYYPSRNVPIPATSYDEVMRTRFMRDGPQIASEKTQFAPPYVQLASWDRLGGACVPKWTEYGGSVSDVIQRGSKMRKEWKKSIPQWERSLAP